MPRFEDHRLHLAALGQAALQAVDPAAAVRRCLTPADLAGAERVFVVGAGKAGVAMARAAAEVVGQHLAAGLVAVPQVPAHGVAGIEFVEGGHPLPTDGSLAAGRAVARLLAQVTPRDLVLALISGGGSALLELPRPGVGLADLQALNTALLKSGAPIHQINLVRQQFSEIKGGGLLRLAYPARVLSLILSDVVGNPLGRIASGPTAPAEGTEVEALAVLETFQLRAALPPRLTQSLLQPRAAAALAPVENRLIASNRLAGEAATARARELGFEAIWLADDWQGEAREVGRQFAARLTAPGCYALVAGGETTVVVRGRGQGGRNQELALAAALTLAGQPAVALATLATDGVDGPTDAAGAIVTGDTRARARALGLEAQAHLDDNNAYPFFAALGDLVVTGPTGTNVNDLIFGLHY